jgi:hypothetical protein
VALFLFIGQRVNNGPSRFIPASSSQADRQSMTFSHAGKVGMPLQPSR